ncbi:MAG TPA: 6-carboxytetrahydropterin synthase QueD [Bryobacteraceae bacterium]|nr:6-carboxytetrahydropterin synthase QueD [Bryobacteraceae bacterium]
MFEVTVERDFASAHALRNYKGACENVHGHNWKVQVVIAGKTLDEAGMLIDFLDVKRMLDAIVARLDHKFLNEVPPFDVKNPSAENLAEHFFERLADGLTSLPVRVKEVKVWETAIQSATYRPQ